MVSVRILNSYSSCKGFRPTVFLEGPTASFGSVTSFFFEDLRVGFFKTLGQIQGAQFCFSPIWSGLVSPELVGPSYLEC